MKFPDVEGCLPQNMGCKNQQVFFMEKGGRIPGQSRKPFNLVAMKNP
jgi:hypothetical protein